MHDIRAMQTFSLFFWLLWASGCKCHTDMPSNLDSRMSSPETLYLFDTQDDTLLYIAYVMLRLRIKDFFTGSDENLPE